MNLRNRMSMKLDKRERIELKPEPKPVLVQIHTAQPCTDKIREELRNELMEMLNKERDEWRRNYDIELNQLKDVIHYNTMKILHETASKIYELEIKCNEFVENSSMDKY